MALAVLVSLLVHALLLGLTFGGDGLGLPGFGLPWQERRFEAPDLQVVLVPAKAAAADSPPPQASIMPQAEPTAQAKPVLDVAADAVAADVTVRGEGAGVAAPSPTPEPAAVIAMERSDESALVVPAAPPLPTPVIAAAPSASSAETAKPVPRDADDLAQERIDREARERAAELARRDRLEREAQQRQAAQREAARIEAARLEDERQEAARQVATRQEAARQEAARREAERAEAARLEAERQEAARQAAARQEAARAGAAQEDAARREAARRAMGRQLDEEAARRDAAAVAAGLPSKLAPSASGTRRGRLFGRSDPNAELILYAEALARKILLNMTFDMVRDAVKRPHADPIVTMAIRSDGSVESVSFVLSSGVAEIDEAIRQVVQSQAPYQAFSPALAREFDVIEIRRSWHFDMAIRLY